MRYSTSLSFVFDGLDLGVFKGRRVFAVGGRVGEPALIFEQGIRFRSLALDAAARTRRHGPTREDKAAHHQLVYRCSCGEAWTRIWRGNAGRATMLPKNQGARREKIGSGPQPEHERGPLL